MDITTNYAISTSHSNRPNATFTTRNLRIYHGRREIATVFTPGLFSVQFYTKTAVLNGFVEF